VIALLAHDGTPVTAVTGRLSPAFFRLGGVGDTTVEEPAWFDEAVSETS
jgi:hypothetical protein